MPTHFWFPDEMRISDVLYISVNGASGGDSCNGMLQQSHETRTAACGDADQKITALRKLITAGESQLLEEKFSELVSEQVAIGILLLLTWTLTRPWRWGLLTTAPFASVFLVSIAWLPFEYGKLELPNKFPQVFIQLKQPHEDQLVKPGLMYLLNKTDSEFVLWDPRERRVLWVPNEMISSAEISESRTLSEVIRSSASGGY